MIEAIAIIASGLIGAFVGYALRASELAQLRTENKRLIEENADLRDFWRFKHNLPSTTGEIKRMESGKISKPQDAVERVEPKFKEGVPLHPAVIREAHVRDAK